MLAILADLTFQLLYDPVANGGVDVANSQSRRNRTDNFNVVFHDLSIGKKESLVLHLNLHSGNPATVFIGLKASTSSGALIDDTGVNATSVHKSEFCCCFFSKACLLLKKPHKTGGSSSFFLGLTPCFASWLSRRICGETTKNVTGSPRQ